MEVGGAVFGAGESALGKAAHDAIVGDNTEVGWLFGCLLETEDLSGGGGLVLGSAPSG